MSMRIVPSSSHPTQTTPSLSAPSAPGIHDTLRSGVGPTLSLPSTTSSKTSSKTTNPSHPVTLDSTHPLESRLKSWQATQDALKMSSLRTTFGMAEPIRRGMELKIVREGDWRPLCLGGASGVHEDILSGRDADLAWEDVFRGEELRGVVGFHEEMERKVGMM